MSDTERLIEYLEKHNRHFFHFTDSRNLKSIESFGIMSTVQLQARGIIAVTGGNQWSLEADKVKGMDKFVHLCFFSQHPMAYSAEQEGRIEKVKFLHVKPAILRACGALISKDVSNKSEAVFGPAESIIQSLDLEVMYSWTDWKSSDVKERMRLAKKCEVLIPDHIPIEYIKNI